MTVRHSRQTCRGIWDTDIQREVWAGERLLHTCFMYMVFPELCTAQLICEAIHECPGWRHRSGTVKWRSVRIMERTKAHIQVEDGKLRLSTRLPEHHPLTSPPANQKKATCPAALTPNSANKTPPQNHRHCEHKPPLLLAWPCSKPPSKAGF